MVACHFAVGSGEFSTLEGFPCELNHCWYLSIANGSNPVHPMGHPMNPSSHSGFIGPPSAICLLSRTCDSIPCAFKCRMIPVLVVLKFFGIFRIQASDLVGVGSLRNAVACPPPDVE